MNFILESLTEIEINCANSHSHILTYYSRLIIIHLRMLNSNDPGKKRLTANNLLFP